VRKWGDGRGTEEENSLSVPWRRGTRLYFGSAVVPVVSAGKASPGVAFGALLGFHKVYSRLLLHAARSRLKARTRAKK
jgi:hypothetical protein